MTEITRRLRTFVTGGVSGRAAHESATVNAVRSIELDQPLTHLADVDGRHRYALTCRDLFEGTAILGANGSGKSSGSGQHLACAFLSNQFGGVVFTVKSDEAAAWANFNRSIGPLGYAARCGRAPEEIIIVGPRHDYYRAMGIPVPDGGHRINVLGAEFEYHAKHDPSAATHNVTHICTTALQACDESRSANDAFWLNNEIQMGMNIVDLCICATDTVCLRSLEEIIRTAPRSRPEAWSGRERARSEFFQRYFLPAVHRTPPTHPRHRDLEQTANYMLSQFPELADRTRSVLVSSFIARVSPLLRGSLRSIFAGDRPDTFAVTASSEGKVIIFDLPVKLYGESGRFGQLLGKTAWQRAMERRDAADPALRNVFSWEDEAHFLVTRHDPLFAATARSQRVAVVLITQNVSNFYTAMSGSDPRAAADSLLGNLQTKIFHANGDAVTNEWAERHFAKDIQLLKSAGLTSSDVGSRGSQESLQPTILAREFTTLRKGGAPNNGVVDAIAFQTGRRWDAKGRNYARVHFSQKAAR